MVGVDGVGGGLEDRAELVVAAVEAEEHAVCRGVAVVGGGVGVGAYEGAVFAVEAPFLEHVAVAGVGRVPGVCGGHFLNRHVGEA